MMEHQTAHLRKKNAGRGRDQKTLDPRTPHVAHGRTMFRFLRARPARALKSQAPWQINAYTNRRYYCYLLASSGEPLIIRALLKKVAHRNSVACMFPKPGELFGKN
jgi:hypothetical protein